MNKQVINVEPLDIQSFGTNFNIESARVEPIHIGNISELQIQNQNQNQVQNVLPYQPLQQPLQQSLSPNVELSEIKYTTKQPAIIQPVTEHLAPLTILSLPFSKNIKIPTRTLEQALLQKGGNDPKFNMIINFYAQMSLQVFPGISNETAATIGELRASKAYYGVTYQTDIENILRFIDEKY